MTREDIQCGVPVRLIAEYHAVPVGSVGKICLTRTDPQTKEWSFGILWEGWHPACPRYTLRVSEADLPCFTHVHESAMTDSLTPPEQTGFRWTSPADQTLLPLEHSDPSATPRSALIRMGTSSWAYEGWRGQVYTKTYKKTTFSRDSLGEYFQYRIDSEPQFDIVGNDSTFYRPPTTAQLLGYKRMMPEATQMCCKVWEEITVPHYARHARYGPRAGQANPNFLNATGFNRLVLQPYRDAQFAPYAGPFLFEFQRYGVEPNEFVERLDAFFAQVPKDFSYAVEVRTPGVLGSAYHDVLQRHGVAHVYNHWSYMPSLATQHATMGSFTAPFTVLRLLTPLGMKYEEAKTRAMPYTKIVEELPTMRSQTVDLVTQAVKQNVRTYVLVNNRAEGNAPLTIQALVDAIRDGL